MTTRVVVADDQLPVRAGLKMVLEAKPDIEVVGETADGEQVLEVARRTKSDVVLMDIRMPVLDGLKASRRLLARDNPPKILVLTTFDDEEYLYEALRAGTSGCPDETRPARPRPSRRLRLRARHRRTGHNLKGPGPVSRG